MNNNDVQTGLRVVSQIPLDEKTHFLSEEDLKNLGINNNLAFTYYEGMQVYCVVEKTRYIWEESPTGLLPVSFTYPNNLIVNGVDYSNKVYNFVPISTAPDGSETKINAGTNVTVSGNGTIATPYIINSSGGVTVNDATSSIKGILRLTGDLGGTADLPTTPTALHITGNESWTGIKSTTNSGVGQNNGIKIINNANGGVGGALDIDVNGVHPGILITNGVNSGRAISIFQNTTLFGSGALAITTASTSNGYAIRVLNASSHESLNLSSTGVGNNIFTTSINADSIVSQVGIGSTTGTGFTYVGKNFTTTTFTVDKLGNITGNSFIKAGGTSTQLLKADGNVIELNPQKSTVVIANYTLTDTDNGTTIFVDTTSTAITITVGSITKAGFCVGFIHKAGSNDITFSGVTNPIGLKSKGQGYQTFIERELATSTYFLLGNTRA